MIASNCHQCPLTVLKWSYVRNDVIFRKLVMLRMYSKFYGYFLDTTKAICNIKVNKTIVNG